MFLSLICNIQEDINLRIVGPDSYQEDSYLKEICDYWDGTGYYFWPSPQEQPTQSTTTMPNQETTSKPDEADKETTTAGGSSAFAIPSLLFFIYPLVIFIQS